MTSIATKKQILEGAGYVYSFDREIYLNRTARKVFSLEFVEDHSEAELKARIIAPVPSSGAWDFNFNSEPLERVKRDLSAMLG